jgi:GntR family transcriptional regulator, transcriptional repressor for pyruvate dehydrogenase complex
MPFVARKVKQPRMFQEVVSQVEQAVRDGRLAPGEGLPSEMQLKQQFETSRGTIREALRVLEQKGLISVRLGAAGGAFVRELDTDKVVESLDLLVHLRKVTMDQLTEFREATEGAVAALAARRARPEGLARLSAVLDEAARCLEVEPPDWRRFLELDVALHIAVAELAENPVYTAVLRVVHESILNGSDRFSERDRAQLEEMYRDLQQLAAALAAGDAERARELAAAHARAYGRRFLRQPAQRGPRRDDHAAE